MPQTSKQVRVALTEDLAFQPVAKPDRDMKRVKELLEQGIVEDVRILGLESENHRRYLEEGIDPQLYDRKACYLNHPHVQNPHDQNEMRRAVGSSRDVEKAFGEMRDPYKTPGQGVFCKSFWFNVDHPYAKTFKRFVMEAPHQIAFSPAQFGDTYDNGDGTTIVERVTEVRSVDLVGRGATTKGLLEGADCDDPMMEDDEDLDAALAEDEGEGEGDDYDLEDAEADDDEESAGSGLDVTPETFAQITKVVEAHLAGKLDLPTAIKKIKILFSTHAAIAESIMPTVQAPKTPADAVKIMARVATRVKGPIRQAVEMVLLENRQFKAKDTKLTKAEKARELLKKSGLPVDLREDAGLIEELMDCRDEKRMEVKIALFKKLFGSPRDSRPRSAPMTPLTESERREAEDSLGMNGGDGSAPITDADRTKRHEEFMKKYAGAGR